MTRMSSNFGIFADRGDPWVSQREGLEKFGRNLATEDANLDRWTLAKQAKAREVKASVIAPRRDPRDPRETRKVNILRKMHAGMNRKPHKVADAARVDGIAPVKAKVRVDCYIIYSVSKDGAVNEHNIANREDAERKFKLDARRFKRGSLRYLEFWHLGGVLYSRMGVE